MSEETPKYTIANDLDRDGEMSADADPFWEYVNYANRVEKGAIADMGFTLDDFKRYIEGLPKERRSKSQIAPFVNAVYDALEQKNWYAALALALTLPDICGDLEKPEPKPKRNLGKRYALWWNTYIAPRYNGFLSGDDCYGLRCAFLHQGLSDITEHTRKLLLGFRFVHPDPNGRLHLHCNRFNNVLQLQVDLFCKDICAGVERWERKKLSKDPEIQDRAKKMLVILPPEMYGGPIFSKRR